MKTKVKQDSKNENLFTVTFDKMTKGELLVLKYALENHETPVGRDVSASLERSLTEAGVVL